MPGQILVLPAGHNSIFILGFQESHHSVNCSIVCQSIGIQEQKIISRAMAYAQTASPAKTQVVVTLNEFYFGMVFYEAFKQAVI